MPDSVSETITSETIRLLQNRVSIRKYSDRPVSEEMIEAILRAAYRAPTSSNIQSYTTIVVRSQEIKDKLYPVTGNQPHVRDTPVFLAFCADLTRIEYAMKKNGHNFDDNNLEVGLVSSVDAALVGMSAYLAAESVGLRGLMIGAVRNNAAETARILGLPYRVYCLFGMCLGWPSEQPPQKPRMDVGATIHYEQYNPDAAVGSLGDYDAQLAAHYEATGRTTTPDSWTHDMDKKFHARLRNNLRAELRGQGFDFK